MDKDKVLPMLIGVHDRLMIAEFQRDADFAVLEQVAIALQLLPRWHTEDYGTGVFCTGCISSRLGAHTPNCPWQKLEALGIVEKAGVETWLE